jgi:PKD repeat protein
MDGSGTVVSGGDGTSSVEFTYDAIGVYTIRLTVTGIDGSTASDQATVTVPGL